MQVLTEGLALAAFGMIRDTTTKPLPRQILACALQDEARHVAFGRRALRETTTGSPPTPVLEPGGSDLDLLMSQDEEVAEQLGVAEVEEAIEQA